MNLLKVKSVGVSPECDIVSLIPRDELQRCFDSVCDAMDKLDLMTESPDKSANYRTDEYMGHQGNSEIPYANYVHSTPGHKCWLLDQTAMPGVTVSANRTNEMKKQIANDYNDQILQFVVNALVAKGYYKIKCRTDINQLLSIFRTIEKYIGNGVEAIYYLSAIRKDAKRYTTLYETDNAAGWVNMILVQWSKDMDPVDRTNLVSSLRNTRFNVSVNFGEENEVKETLTKYVDELRSHDVAFMFLCDNDEGYGKVLVFKKYRNYDIDQAVIRVTTNTKISTNIPENIEMLATVGGTFTFVATTDKLFSLYSMTVNGKCYTLNSRGLIALAELGITIVEKTDSELYNQFTITISKIKSNMDIHLADAPYGSYLIAQNIFSIVNTDEMDKPSIILNAPTSDVDSNIEGILQFKFNGSVDENLIDRANVELIPVYLYDKLEDEDSKFVSTTNEVSFINIGMNGDRVCQVHFSGEGVNMGSTFLVRVTFPEKSIVGSVWGISVRKPTPVKYFNQKFMIQFEISMTASEIVSVSESVKMAINTWTPMIPSPVLTTKFKLSNADVYPWYTLNEEGGIFTLTKNENYAGDIPNLVPESSIYKPIVTYKSAADNNDFVEIPENAKFAVFSVPIGLVLPYYYSNGDQIDIVTMSVNSSVPVKFNNMVCSDSAYFYRASDGVEGVIYSNLKRPYLNGYIDVPVLFMDKDVVEINLCVPHTSTLINPSNGLYNMSCRVIVDLPESVTDTDEGSEEGTGKEPNSGDNSDTPIDGGNTDPITPSEGEEGGSSEDGTTDEETGVKEPEIPTDEPSKDVNPDDEVSETPEENTSDTP